MTWFLCRHGETLMNRKSIVQGRYASLLTLKGIDQIKSIAYRILDHEKDFSNYKLICSPVVRTRQTMQIIQEILGITDKKVIEDELITETDTGDYTLLSWSYVKEKFPNFESDRHFQYPNGENKQDVYARIVKFYEKIKDEENLIVVSHGNVSRQLAYLRKGLSQEEAINDKMDQNHFYISNKDKFELA